MWALRNVSFQVNEGEALGIVGHNGAGKTTILKILSGITTPTAGEILIGGVVVNDLPPRERRIAMVFQSYALYPHLSVFQNIAFPLKAQKVKRELHRGKVNWAASLLGIGHLLLEAQESRMDHPTTMRSIELMGAKVIPAMATL